MNEKSAISALGALAQETRLKAFRLLVEAGPAGMQAGIIADALGVPAPTLSFHLAQLTRAGLILQRRNSRMLIYSVNIAEMNGLLSYLTENCCGGATSCAPVCRPGIVAPSETLARRKAGSRSRRRG
jgi:ArsR family transcriptional regulator, arsenate/arsenite/antimonite-responsive transcriptional repressor